MDAPAPAPRYPVWLGLASFGWAVAGWVLAASAPGMAFVPGVELLHVVLPGVTAALILANLAFSLHALFRRKVAVERLLLVTGLQIGLFTTLFFQFAAHLGADCYAMERPARSWEWVQFSVAHAARAADVLIAELTAAATGDEGRADRALAALGRLGPNAREAVGPLAEALGRHPDRRAKTVETLGRLGPDAVGPLRDIATNEKGAEAEAAITGLRRVGPRAAPALVAVWGKSRKRRVRDAAEAALRDLGREAMPALVEATGEANAAAHLHWFKELDYNWALRASSNRTFRALVRLQRFRDHVERSDGGRPPGGEFEAQLREQPFMSVELLEGIRDSGKLALPVFISALSNKKDDVRKVAIEALGGLGPPAARAVPELRICLRPTQLNIPELTSSRNEPEVRRLAAVALGKIGPSADDAEEKLIEALAGEDVGVRAAAASALGAIRPRRREAVPALSKALADKDGEVRRAAAVALGMYGRDARAALPELTKLAWDDKIIGAAEARAAIGRIRGE